jgi:hypothetical protein
VDTNTRQFNDAKLMYVIIASQVARHSGGVRHTLHKNFDFLGGTKTTMNTVEP